MPKKKTKKKTATVKKKTKNKAKTQKRAATLISMEDVYRLVNRVQLDKKEVKFCVVSDDSSVVENVLQDLGLDYNIDLLGSKTAFKIFPIYNEIDEVPDIFVDFIDDEIIEDGQIF